MNITPGIQNLVLFQRKTTSDKQPTSQCWISNYLKKRTPAFLRTQKNRLRTHMLIEDCLKERTDTVQFYTGLPSFAILTALYTPLEVSMSHTSHNALTKFQEMIIFLICLRLNNVPLQDLAYRCLICKLVCYGVLKLLLAGFTSPRPWYQERSTSGWLLPLCSCDEPSGQSDTPPVDHANGLPQSFWDPGGCYTKLFSL